MLRKLGSSPWGDKRLTPRLHILPYLPEISTILTASPLLVSLLHPLTLPCTYLPWSIANAIASVSVALLHGLSTGYLLASHAYCSLPLLPDSYSLVLSLTYCCSCNVCFVKLNLKTTCSYHLSSCPLHELCRHPLKAMLMTFYFVIFYCLILCIRVYYALVCTKN